MLGSFIVYEAPVSSYRQNTEKGPFKQSPISSRTGMWRDFIYIVKGKGNPCLNIKKNVDYIIYFAWFSYSDWINFVIIVSWLFSTPVYQGYPQYFLLRHTADYSGLSG